MNRQDRPGDEGYRVGAHRLESPPMPSAPAIEPEAEAAPGPAGGPRRSAAERDRRTRRVHLVASLGYAVVCAIGTAHPYAGLVMIALFTAGASLRALLRNVWLVWLMLIATVAGFFIPTVAL